MEYYFQKDLAKPYEDAVNYVSEKLAGEGFGILTTIDVKETLKKKLGVDHRPFVILGACNPPLAKQAIEAEPNIALFLPCNVIVYELDSQTSRVAIFRPSLMKEIVSNNSSLLQVADQAEEKLKRVLDSLE